MICKECESMQRQRFGFQSIKLRLDCFSKKFRVGYFKKLKDKQDNNVKKLNKGLIEQRNINYVLNYFKMRTHF